MVLVDTSVWIRALSGAEPFRSDLDALLEANDVAGHEMVYGELLIGDPGGPSAVRPGVGMGGCARARICTGRGHVFMERRQGAHRGRDRFGDCLQTAGLAC